MKNDTAGIVYDRDVAQPEEKMKKRKKVKRPPNEINANSKIISQQLNNNMNNRNNIVQNQIITKQQFNQDDNDGIDGMNDQDYLYNNANDINSRNNNGNNDNNNYASENKIHELNQENKEMYNKENKDFYSNDGTEFYNMDNNINNQSSIEEDYNHNNINQTYKNNLKSNNLNNVQNYYSQSKADESSYYQDKINQKRKSESLNNKNNNKNSNNNSKYEYNQECDDLAQRISELEEIQEMYSKHVCPSIEDYQRQIDDLRRELDKKERAIQSLVLTNKKQRNALESLSKELDDKLDKTSFGSISHANKIHTQGNKPNSENNKSLEHELLLKEKELNNAMDLIKILSRDKAQLKTSLDTFGEYQKKLQLLDLSKSKDTEIQALNNELVLLKRQAEEHQLCRKNKDNQQIGTNMLKEEIKLLRKEIALLRKKNNNLTSVQAGLANQNEIARAERSAEICDNANNFNPNPNVKRQIIKYKNRTRSMSPIQDSNKNNKHIPKDKTPTRNDIFHELFTDDEKEMLIRLYNDNDKYDQFIKKIIILETSRNALDKKYKIIIAQYMDKIAGLDEQIEYLNQKNKESESRLSIFQCQVNELKQSKKAYQKKITEYQGNIQQFETQLKEKKQEVNMLTHQLNNIRNQKMELMKDVPSIDEINQLQPDNSGQYNDQYEKKGKSNQLVDFNEEKDNMNREDY